MPVFFFCLTESDKSPHRNISGNRLINEECDQAQNCQEGIDCFHSWIGRLETLRVYR